MYRPAAYAVAAMFLASTAIPAMAAQMAPESAAQQKADTDFGKLSKDGRHALQEIRLVRLDIFDGHIPAAKTNIAKALASLTASQSDDTVFTKAESDLKAPASMPANSKASTSPVAWIPVDGAMTLDEDYVATPEKAAHVNKANENLAKGDKKAALDELKLADVGVSFVSEVAPLKATMDGVKQASDFLGEGKYYEANQSLKTVEDGMRFDTDILAASPKANAAGAKPGAHG